MWLYIYPLIYFITISVGFVYYHKFKQDVALMFFLGFLIYSFFTEVIGNYCGRILGINTFYIYNLWHIVNHLFYMIFFLYLMKGTFKGNLLKWLLVIYIIIVSIDIIFIENFITQGLINIMIIGSLFVVISVMLFFIELINRDEILEIQKTLVFWIAIGVLLFNIGFIPIIIIAEFIAYRGIFSYIILTLNIIMSFCFITGFIVSKKECN
ncbi:hypothetical protein SAMN06265371_102374 [Lutibacter agarilyticus]|uniref:YhhN-like protein n=1 Tax=Lutibacter agarilyticus TaxID=1109740 RepID=A0A238W2M0_9FLAO|nr:hypothetical protein [Lutibacter agarilyticus]SNR40845.1 hypothetical protein SAMN06265371_102374 [Lutibacter agarilyticus]